MPSHLDVIGRFIWNSLTVVFGLLLGFAVGWGVDNSVTRASAPRFCNDNCIVTPQGPANFGDDRTANLQSLSQEAWYHCAHSQPIGKYQGLNPGAPFIYDVFLFGSHSENKAQGIAIRSEQANDTFRITRVFPLKGEFLDDSSIISVYLRPCVIQPRWANALLRVEVLAILVGSLLLIGRIILPGAVVLGAGLMALYPQLMLMLMIIWSLLVARNY